MKPHDQISAVAMVFIVINSIGLYLISTYEVHDLDEQVKGDWRVATWVFDKMIPESFYHVMFWHYSILFAYELYDLRNCIVIKMYSGVLHHIVLLIIFPMVWHVSTMCIPAVWMSTMTYWTNIPAHLRSFMAVLKMRETKLYEINKHAWWYSYAILRLFFIPWWSSQMWYTRKAILSQSYPFLLTYYLAAMVVHYSLSLYWFLGMTKSFYPSIPRLESRNYLNKSKDSPSNSEDEGGQKFD